MTITLTREEAQQVLELITNAYVNLRLAEILRARLSAPELEKRRYEEESCPVCGYYCLGKGGVYCIDKPKLCGINTAPQQRNWQGLTDEEKVQVALDCDCISADWIKVVETTEAKLKEKNT